MKVRKNRKITQSILDKQEHTVRIYHGKEFHTVICKDGKGRIHFIRRSRSPAEAMELSEKHLDEVNPNRERRYIAREYD